MIKLGVKTGLRWVLWWMLGTDKTQVVKFVTVWRHGLESDIIIIPSEILGVR